MTMFNFSIFLCFRTHTMSTTTITAEKTELIPHTVLSPHSPHKTRTISNSGLSFHLTTTEEISSPALTTTTTITTTPSSIPSLSSNSLAMRSSLRNRCRQRRRQVQQKNHPFSQLDKPLPMLSPMPLPPSPQPPTLTKGKKLLDPWPHYYNIHRMRQQQQQQKRQFQVPPPLTFIWDPETFSPKVSCYCCCCHLTLKVFLIQNHVNYFDLPQPVCSTRNTSLYMSLHSSNQGGFVTHFATLLITSCCCCCHMF